MSEVEGENDIESQFGFPRLKDGSRLGWLMNMQPSDIKDPETGLVISAVDYYFIEQDGRTFKLSVAKYPYFYIYVDEQYQSDIVSHLKIKFQKHIYNLEVQAKEDLSLKNHLSGLKREYIKIEFFTINDLLHVRSHIAPFVSKNQDKKKLYDSYFVWENGSSENNDGNEKYKVNPLEYIKDIREYDVPYYIRVSIDLNIRVGYWYDISFRAGVPSIRHREDLLHRAELKVMAFDIETTKLPLKFPDADIDSIMMISYMVDGQGYLIINREVVGEDIEDFEYTPKPEFEGPFSIFNELNEVDLLNRFFEHIRELRPNIYVTYNGDFFDWPFIEARAKIHGMYVSSEIGVYRNSEGEYRCRFASHLDAFKWVVRDSYLPVGSQGLKAVTKAKLGYDPVEIDPEDMVKYAKEKAQLMSSYSVSDAVATYYLYMKYVHPFIFSLCTIIPMNPDDVLRKGSGTLCETLLMVEAANINIIFPNKKSFSAQDFYEGHLIESETYIGGHVEALESGVFRSDLEENFQLDKDVLDELMEQLEDTLKYTIEIENNQSFENVVNFEEVKSEILSKLNELRERPNRKECPNIYHLDVGAMYPNIILTNRLQPSAIVSDEICASCDFNTPDSDCQRPMNWTWKGDFIPATSAEYKLILSQLESERFKPVSENNFNNNNQGNKGQFEKNVYNKSKNKFSSMNTSYNQSNEQKNWKNKYDNKGAGAGDGLVPYAQLPQSQKTQLLTKRLKDYSKKVYGKTHKIKTEQRTGIICQRENPFYVDTVRAFRDRRYKYKDDLKYWKGKLDKAQEQKSIESIQEAVNMNILYDSLQLAHKCILNSFYGYVMRKGARWFSMEMAGIVTHAGSNIIKRAREVVEGIGTPLELDTDGIWTLLPKSFPENFQFNVEIIDTSLSQSSNNEQCSDTQSTEKLSQNDSQKSKIIKKKIVFSYPCVMLNYRVRKEFSNDQYQVKDANTGKYKKFKECSILFEIDGPYRAMILPASIEEGKKLKKRYAVFNKDGSLAELKGFEIKRRGELKLVKLFQSQVFQSFLEGKSKEECYEQVGKVANYWLDILDSKGKNIVEDELISFIECSNNMSRKLEDYGSQKSTAITTAKRLSEFLGAQIVKDKGLACKFIISNQPGVAIVERAIPVAIFHAEKPLRDYYLHKWIKSAKHQGGEMELREIVDWEYYINRLAGAIRKIITIPAAMQKIKNPVPRLPHPAWLVKKINQNNGKQLKLNFQKKQKDEVEDIESLFEEKEGRLGKGIPMVTKRVTSKEKAKEIARAAEEEEEEDILSKPMPDPTQDYDAWLEWNKKKWKLQARSKNQRRGGYSLSNKRQTRPGEDDEEEDDDMEIVSNKRRKLGDDEGEGEENDRSNKTTRKRMIRRTPIKGAKSRTLLNQIDLFYENEWEIIKIEKIENKRGEEVGEYKVWVFISNELYKIQLVVPKVFYINSKIKNPYKIESLPYVQLVNKQLPHSKKNQYLYEFKLNFNDFEKYQKSLQNLLNHPDIEGIYESNTPSLFRIIMKIGCLAKLIPPGDSKNAKNAKNKKTNHSTDRFQLDELEYIKQNENNQKSKNQFNSLSKSKRYMEYSLENQRMNYFKICFIYASSTETRSYYSIFVKHTKEVHFYFISAFPKCSTANLEKMIEATKLGAEGEGFKFNYKFLKSKGEAYYQINQFFQEYKQKNYGATICLFENNQQNQQNQQFYEQCKSLKDNFPIVHLPSNEKDNLFPVFGWEGFCCKLSIQRYVDCFSWFKKQLEFCEFTQIPIGNIFDVDFTLFSMDLFYSRILSTENHLLWTSSSDFPDLGNQMLNKSLFTPFLNYSTSHGNSSEGSEFDSNQSFPIYLKSCFYENISIHLSVKNLPVNTIIQSHHVNDIESLLHSSSSTTLSSSSDNKSKPNAENDTQISDSTPLDESLLCFPAFRVLKQLVNHLTLLLTDTRYSRYAEVLIENIYRWMSSPGSYLYDPAMLTYLHSLMKKIFLQLLAELKSLGCTIIFASYNQIIINTPKPTLSEAKNYINFIITTLKKKKLFSWLILEANEYWSSSLFLDNCNYSSVIASDLSFPGDAENDENQHRNQISKENLKEKESERRATIINKWDLINYLPDNVKDSFSSIIEDYLNYLHNANYLEAFYDSLNNENRPTNENTSNSALMKRKNGKHKEIINKYITNRLFTIVNDIQNSISTIHQNNDISTQGNAQASSNPSLLFIVYICKILSLDTSVTQPVFTLQKNLFKIAQIKEFSKETEFVNPSESFLMQDIMCKFCSYVRDIDILRDERILSGDWNCKFCQHSLDKNGIEKRLVDILQRKSLAYQLQDLVCSKCEQIKEDNNSLYCKSCSGQFFLTIKKTNMDKFVKQLLRIADLHDFDWLKETASWMANC